MEAALTDATEHSSAVSRSCYPSTVVESNLTVVTTDVLLGSGDAVVWAKGHNAVTAVIDLLQCAPCHSDARMPI